MKDVKILFLICLISSFFFTLYAQERKQTLEFIADDGQKITFDMIRSKNDSFYKVKRNQYTTYLFGIKQISINDSSITYKYHNDNKIHIYLDCRDKSKEGVCFKINTKDSKLWDKGLGVLALSGKEFSFGIISDTNWCGQRFENVYYYSLFIDCYFEGSWLAIGFVPNKGIIYIDEIIDEFFNYRRYYLKCSENQPK